MERKEKKLIFYLIFIIFIILFINLAYAADQVIEISYTPTFNNSVFNTIDYTSYLLRVYTESDMNCKYSITKGLYYSDMSGNFDYNSGKVHEKTFNNINDGIYIYYIKCTNSSFNNSFEPGEFIFNLRINSLISGDIVLNPKSPLKSGKVELTLTTSKSVSLAPSLSYSYDGIAYNKIPLFGSETNWKGYFIIPASIGEAVGSFRLNAVDLEGRTGDKIINGGVFTVDTIKPKTISYINSLGYLGQVKLEWYYDENIEKFKIYKSNSPNTDYTNYYTISDKSPFLDNIVEKGKTYYYRVSGVDEAGNEGDLSREVSSTALIDNSSQISGLAIGLVGSVDNFISEINYLISDIDNIASSISLKSEKEKNLFSELGFSKEADNSKSELNSLKNDVLKYKLQDLSKAELESKLTSSKLKLDIIKKKVPEDIVIVLEDSQTENIQKEDIQNSLVELNPAISDKNKAKDLRDSLKLIEDSGLKIQSNFYVCDIVYLDGTKKEISIIERNINSQLEKQENASFYEFIPKELSESASQVHIKNTDSVVVKEDPIISFGLDNKKIFYYFNKAATLSSLRTTKILLISLSKENSDSESSITGYSIFLDSNNYGYLGIIIGIIFFFGLFFYFIYQRKKRISPDFLELDCNVDDAFNLIKKGEINESKKIYDSLNETYKKLSSKEKQKAYPIIESLKNKIMENYKNDK